MINTKAPLLLALFLTALPGFWACEKAQKQILVESISVCKTSVELVEGDSFTLTANIAPSNATNKKINWKSDNTTVATVNQSGNITAVKAGKATVSVISEDGGKSATCAVTVKAKVITVSGVTLDKTSASLKVGGTITLEATVNPSDATNKTVNWSSSNEDIAIVSDGVVTAKKIGNATIIAKVGGETATCEITVVATMVESISLDKSSASLMVGETVNLTATVSPSDATDKTVTWSTSDATVVLVYDGLVTAQKIGNATITAKAGGKTATCTVTIVPTHVMSVTLNITTASLIIGETLPLIATVSPDDATDKSVRWSSDNESVLTVSAEGIVTALKVGKATVTATTADHGKTATCTVEVSKEPGTIDGGLEGTGEDEFVY